MTFTETDLKDCYIITPKVFEDERGYFFESFSEKKFEEKTGLSVKFVQDNQSKSSRGVIRGLHFQTGTHSQAKLVGVVKGSVLDVCVDIRQGSPTYGKTFSIILDTIKNQRLFVPRGFAHGFAVLEDDTIFTYKCDNYYHKASEGGINYKDDILNINWKLSEEEMIVSEKDQQLPSFNALV